MEIDELAVKITGDSTSLQSAMNQATDAMGKLGINTSMLTGLLGAAGLTAAFKMAYDAADKMVQAYRSDETALLKYNAALAASTVITAQGKRALDEYVPVFASLSGIAEADTQAQIARLAAYGRTDEQIKTMMETALGMSTVLDMDVNNALTQLNMTFSGTIGRLGQQIPALKSLTAEQLSNGEGIKLLNSKYGEFSGTLKNSTDVSIKNFENAWSDLMSTMGQSIAGTIQPLRDALTDLFRLVINSISETNKLNDAHKRMADGTATLNDKLTVQVGILNNLKYARDSAAYDPTVSKEELADLDKAIAAQQKVVDELKNKSTAQDNAAEAAKKAAAATIAAEAEAKKAVEDAIAAQIKGRKEAQAAYESSLSQIETKVKLGVMTEQEAADAKYAANQKLIEDLIALGYTGARETGQIGDKALADAVARDAVLYASTKDVVDKTLADRALLLEQQKEVAKWEKEYLEGKKKEVDPVLYQLMLERIAREQALIEYQAYLKEMAEKAAYTAEVERIAYEQRTIEYGAYLKEMEDKAAYQAEVERIANAQKLIEYQAYLQEMEAKAKLAEEVARIAQEQKLIEYQAYLDEMTDRAAYQAEVERIAQAQKLVEYQAYLDEMETRANLAAETERIAQEQKLIEYQQFLGSMAEKAAYEEEKARIAQEQKLIEYQAFLQGMEVAAKYATEKARIEQEQKLVEYLAYLGDMETAAIYAAEVERIANEQKLLEYQAYLDEMEEKANLADETARIAQAQKLIEYQAYLKEMEDRAAYQTAKEQIEYEQRGIEYEQYLKEMADKAAYAAEKERIEAEQKSIDIAASYEKYLAEMAEKAAKAAIEQAEYARAVEAADVEAKKTSLQKKIEAIKAQLEKEILLVGENENAKKILIENANKEILKSQAETFAPNASIILGSLSLLFSGIGSLIRAQADNAVDAVERRLERLKKSYGDTASSLQTMYDALEKMGATDKAATIKAQLDKEKAVEDYASLSMEQLASLYATAIEMGDSQTAAEITAAQARVKAEKDAAEEIKKIKYDAAVAEWNMKLMSTTASAAQAVMDTYKAMISLGPLGITIAPIAAAASAAFGITQIAAVAEAKPKLDTGGVIRAREETPFAVGKGTGEIMFGTSSLGDPLMQGFADLVAARVSRSPGASRLLPVQIVLDGRVVAESTVKLIDDGQVRFRKPLKVAQR